MSKKILALNLALLALLVLGGFKFRNDWREFDPAHDVAKIQPAPQTFPPLATPPAATAQAADWTDIPSRNMFSFDRSDIDIAPVVEAEPPKPSGPKPVLIGTMIMGKSKTAFVGKSAKAMEVGQEVDGWKILDILRDAILIESNGVQDSVKVNDPTASAGRNAAKTTLSNTAPSVISFTAPANASATVMTSSANSTAAGNGTAASPAPTISAPPGSVLIQTPWGFTTVSEGAAKK